MIAHRGRNGRARRKSWGGHSGMVWTELDRIAAFGARDFAPTVVILLNSVGGPHALADVQDNAVNW